MDLYFPNDDMMVESLSRISLKTLNTLRCTCQKIRSLTYSSYFWDLYKQRNNIVSGFIVLNYSKIRPNHEFAASRESKSLDLSFLPQKAQILASSEQGIVVFECPHPKNYKINRYHVCKPTTKQILKLPNPKTRYLTEKVAIVLMGSNPFHYKIIRLSSPKKSFLWTQKELYTTYCCEIFDSMKWAWRYLELVMFPYCVLLDNPQPITIGNSIYMLTTDDEVFKVDAYLETWTMLSLPKSTVEYPCYTLKKLVKYEDKLGFACKPPNGPWEIWVRTNIDESWEKMFVFEDEDNFEGFYDSDTSVIKDYNKLLFTRFKRDSYIHKVALKDQLSHQKFVLRSDFEMADLMGGQKVAIDVS
ncbi:putative F-box protein At5g52610 [Rutidosis leptorrhynchoides]|uniref:putative F-box protein At5g52610 n=1 Tax=Rutidosis leptorrhynchoides TaxID=125765 RepID=UPI003A9A091B